ncbi:MAG TPA: TolC family protein [Anaeromyxobacteraceae bacterium]|nr:TolC family protein [Anaeromyxobacteraceae bacterium]
MVNDAGRIALVAVMVCAAAPAAGGVGGDHAATATADPERAAAGDPVTEAEARIGHVVRLEDLLALARARNPDVLELRERAGAARERASGAGRLPDLELQAEIQNTPLTSPLSFRESEMWMLGLRQTFPALGTRAARGRAANAEAGVASESTRARERDVVRDVRRAYWEYHRAEQALRIRREVIDLTRRVADLARAAYESGRGSQQDVLRTAVEVARIQAELGSDEQALRSAQVMLNALTGREPDAALGETAEVRSHDLRQGLDELDATLVDRRPELVAARRAIERSEASLDAARRQARLPTLMVGVDYGYMPRKEETATAAAMPAEESPAATAAPEMDRHFYTVMVGVNLPWLNPGRKDAVREAERSLAADRRALDAIRATSRFQLRDAMARYHAARIAFDQMDRDIVPKARQSLEAAQGAFGVGRGDALGLVDSLRSYLAIRLERERALASLEAALADVERAMGDDVEANRTPAPLNVQETP